MRGEKFWEEHGFPPGGTPVCSQSRRAHTGRLYGGRGTELLHLTHRQNQGEGRTETNNMRWEKMGK